MKNWRYESTNLWNTKNGNSLVWKMLLIFVPHNIHDMLLGWKNINKIIIIFLSWSVYHMCCFPIGINCSLMDKKMKTTKSKSTNWKINNSWIGQPVNLFLLTPTTTKQTPIQASEDWLIVIMLIAGLRTIFSSKLCAFFSWKPTPVRIQIHKVTVWNAVFRILYCFPRKQLVGGIHGIVSNWFAIFAQIYFGFVNFS